MMKVINMLLFSLVLSGCSSPPPPVPVEWDEPGQSVNTGLPKWRDNPIIIPSPIVIDKWLLSIHIRNYKRHAGRPLYFTRPPTLHVLLLQRHQAQNSLLQKTGCVDMAQKALLNINLSLDA